MTVKIKLRGILQPNCISICPNAFKTVALSKDNSDFCMFFFKHKYTDYRRVILIF